MSGWNWTVGETDAGNVYVVEGEGFSERYVAFRVKDRETAALLAAAPKLKAALEQAVVECPCSVRERYSGHRSGCSAPQWVELLMQLDGCAVKEAEKRA